MSQDDLTKFFDSSRKKSGKEKAEEVFEDWEFKKPDEEEETEEQPEVIEEKTEEEIPEQPSSAGEVIKEALEEDTEKPEDQAKPEVSRDQRNEVPLDIEEVIEKEVEEEQPQTEVEEKEEPKEEVQEEIAEETTEVELEEALQKEEAEEEKPEEQKTDEVKVDVPLKEPPTPKDEFVAKTMHNLIMQSGWSPLKTTPEKDYFFYNYLPPSEKRTWMQARVYVSKLSLDRPIKIEGLTIPGGMEERLTIIIRMQKSGGIDRIKDSKTVIETMDTNNYFNENSEIIDEYGLQSVLSSYLKDAEIL